MLVYHRIVYIPFIMTLIFESQCVELIHLRTISLIDVSLPGIVYQVLLSNQNKYVASSKLNLNSKLRFFRILICLLFIVLITL